MEASQKKKIESFSREISFLNPSGQIYLTKLWTDMLEEDQTLLERTAHIWLGKLYLKTKAEEWMESRLEKDVTLPPGRLAYECRYFLKLKRKMTPWLIHLARNVKNRILHRKRRALAKEFPGNNKWEGPPWGGVDLENQEPGSYVPIEVGGIVFPPPDLDFSSLKNTRDKIREQAKRSNLIIEDERLIGEGEMSQLKNLFPLKAYHAFAHLSRSLDGRFFYKENPLVRVEELIRWGGGVEILSFQLIFSQKVPDQTQDVYKKRGVYFVFRCPGVPDVEIASITYGKEIFNEFSMTFEGLMGCGYSVKKYLRYRKHSRTITIPEEVVEVEFPDVIEARFFRDREKSKAYGVELKTGERKNHGNEK
jgi:hypothetical protein